MADMTAQASSTEYPELVVAIAGPIGVNMELIVDSIIKALHDVDYNSTVIKLTKEIGRYEISDVGARAEIDGLMGSDTFHTYMRKMSEANALRKQYADPSILSAIAIDAIRRERLALTGSLQIAKPKHAYIIRQLKRPEEVRLLRKVYGRQFVLASAYASERERREGLSERLSGELSTSSQPSEIGYQAGKLIERDASEDEEALGQQLRNTFHLADVFIDGLNKAAMDAKLERFFSALFGRNDISPSKDEYGMYAAKSASLRSSDLSRQVGAAIFSDDGELITQGCNEVPKAHGGTYWDLESPDFRDIKKGRDQNEHFKREVVRDLIERLRSHDHLSPKLLALGNDNQIVESLIAKRGPPEMNGALATARIMDLTEYGRVVHAEMSTICDAARLGRTIKGATLFVTTFPCHVCTKHIIAAGLKRVVYMEPYPKSRAKDLHPDEIEVERQVDEKVSFVPFIGISPFRYREIFQKGRRKNDDGTAQDWYGNKMRPLVEATPGFFDNETWALASLLGEVSNLAEAKASPQDAQPLPQWLKS
jgi:cytidine deaminase